MTSLIIASFKQEPQAIEALHKLFELEAFGDITIYEKVIVKKNIVGETVVLQEDTTEGLPTLSGMAVGSLIGAMAGPVRLLVGMFTCLLNYLIDSDECGLCLWRIFGRTVRRD